MRNDGFWTYSQSIKIQHFNYNKLWEREGWLGSWNAGTKTGDSQVGEWPRVAGGDPGSDTGDAQVGGWTRVVYTVGIGVAGKAG